MRSSQLLADGYHVDESGNVISCTYVNLRDPVDRSPITTLTKASSKRHVIPGSEMLRKQPLCAVMFTSYSSSWSASTRARAGSGASA